MVWNPAQKRQRRRGLAAFAASVAGLVGAYGVLISALALLGRSA